MLLVKLGKFNKLKRSNAIGSNTYIVKQSTKYNAHI